MEVNGLNRLHLVKWAIIVGGVLTQNTLYIGKYRENENDVSDKMCNLCKRNGYIWINDTVSVRQYIKVYFYMKFGRLRYLGGLLKFKMADFFSKNSIFYPFLRTMLLQ